MTNQETAQKTEMETKSNAQIGDVGSTRDAQLEDLPATQAQQDDVIGGFDRISSELKSVIAQVD